ncbi:NADPH-dependent FMN reductase [Piscinibacterium candidicorallinum]|uniref:NADPH-dependent FMN reductase n=1 Tax=Piscinibacterium candidicorallinum TaxID=1793872 RepID=A0ABV7GYY6_9BURK
MSLSPANPSAPRAPRIALFAASARRDALSKRLAAACVAPLQAAGADVMHLDLNDHTLPLYRGDEEAAALAQGSLPAAVVALQQVFARAEAFLVVTPEYNGSIPPLLKNTLDWCSRPNPADPARSGGVLYANKPAALMATSPGPLGGMRALFHARDVLGYLNMIVLPQQLAVGRAHEAIAEGKLIDERQHKTMVGICEALVHATFKLGSHP